MIDPLVAAESAFCWILASYALNPGPAAHADHAQLPTNGRRRNILLSLSVRCSVPSILLALSIRPWNISLAIALLLLAASGIVCWLRQCRVAIRHLAQFELLSSLAVALPLWLLLAQNGTAMAMPWLTPPARLWSTAACISAAVLLFTIQGGNFIVRGILEKAGGMPKQDDTSAESAQSFTHGRIIGQIERFIVLLIVLSGNLSALAFFFAAKGLIRSKELEKRSQADYFLLGSLASFAVALAAGLLLRSILAALVPAVLPR